MIVARRAFAQGMPNVNIVVKRVTYQGLLNVVNRLADKTQDTVGGPCKLIVRRGVA